MERKKKKQDYRPEAVSAFRIWPGVILITACACLLFSGVYFLGYNANLLSMPDILRFFVQDEAETEENGNTAQNLSDDIIPSETTLSYYQPENADPVTLLHSVKMPENFHQRMRFTTTGSENGDNRSWIVNLYAADDCWRIEQGNMLYISDGENLWRSNANGSCVRTKMEVFTWCSLLGIPDLETLQTFAGENAGKVAFREKDMTIEVDYQPGNDSRIVCQVSADTGLVTELRVFSGEQQILLMYTERVSVDPEICGEPSLFSWTEEELK